MREALYNRAWGVVASDCQAYCTRLPHRKLMTLSTKRSAEGRLRKRRKPTLTGGADVTGQVVPTKGGGPPGSPLSPR